MSEETTIETALTNPATPFALENPPAQEEGTFNVDSLPDIGILPKHPYRVHCLAVESKVSRNGNAMLVFNFEVIAPDTLLDAEGKTVITAKTKFMSWFVWSSNPGFKRSCQGLYRGFGLVKKNYRSMDEMQSDLTKTLTETAKGSTFLWELYTEPQYKREQLTESEKTAGKTEEEAAFILDDQGQKILERHNVQGPWSSIIGGFERFTV